MKSLKFHIHWSFIMLGILMFIFGRFQAFLSCIICVLLHELGHAHVGRKLGYKLNVITLMPYGAMLSGKNIHIKNQDEIKIAIAGPVVNAILIILCFFLIKFFSQSYDILHDFVLANFYTLLFNLLPVYPLDGGRICLSILSKNNKRTRAYAITRVIGFIITAIMFLLFFVSAFLELNYMLGINAIFMLIGLLEDDREIYYQKLETLEKFSYSKNNKQISLSKEQTIFDAYKTLIETNAKIITFENNGKKYEISKNMINQKILQVPIYTKLCEIV